MSRAAVLIGVKKSGQLVELQATTRGVSHVAAWLNTQGIPSSRIVVLSDDKGRVTVRDIKDAIELLMRTGPVDQLIVYFSGHGMVRRLGEIWLLSGAPDDPDEAVDVASSVEFARWCGVAHVVFISDACRTAPEGLQAQNVTGGEVFPNTPTNTPENPVDQFFACTLGSAALEVKDPRVSAGAYKAVFTDALVDALIGQEQAPLDVAQEGGHSVGYVRPRPLRDYLRTEVANRLRAAGVPASLFQTPDARITSDPGAWLSRLDPAPGAGPPPTPPPAGPVPSGGGPTPAQGPTPPGGTPGPGGGLPPTSPPTPPASPGGPTPQGTTIDSLAGLADNLVRGASLSGQWSAADLQSATDSGVPGADLLGEAVRQIEIPFGPGHFETGCGFKVSGKSLTQAHGIGVDAEVGDLHDIARVHSTTRQVANVLLVFDDGTSTVLPAIPDFIGALRFEGDELADVSYEPSEGSMRWPEYAARRDELRRLRALISASSRLGVFQLEGDASSEMLIARSMQSAKGIDPVMALYAAYAYQGLSRRRHIAQMEDVMYQDLNLRFFDVALLARTPQEWRERPPDRVFPDFPLLSQGWALLPVYGIEMPPSLTGIKRYVSDSLWTAFTGVGTEMLVKAMRRELVH